MTGQKDGPPAPEVSDGEAPMRKQRDEQAAPDAYRRSEASVRQQQGGRHDATRRNKAHPDTLDRAQEGVEPVSDQQLSRFLKALAVVYKDKTTGNPGLSLALSRLSDQLLANFRDEQSTRRRRVRADQKPSYQTMGFDEIVIFIDDSRNTKEELIQLALERFELPPGKLARMSIADLRDAIHSAISRERSLDVIAEEASRQGANRKT